MTQAEIDADEQSIRGAIMTLLDERGTRKTICPSEVARRLAGASSDRSWRETMPAIRAVAARLAAEGRIRVTRRGQPVEPLSASGPIRLGLPPESGH